METKKKQAGIERPYTWGEFFNIIRGIVREQVPYWHELDYFNLKSEFADKQVDLCVHDWRVVSQTDFGPSEGVYSDFYVYVGDEPCRWLAVAKTLHENDDAYVSMHEFAARVCLAIRHYVKEHEDEFNWTGYDVGYLMDNKRITYMLAHKYENALKYANELKARGKRAWIRNNETREYQEI